MEDMKKSSNTTSDAMEKQKNTVAELASKLSLAENAYGKSVKESNSYKTSLNTAEAGLEKIK